MEMLTLIKQGLNSGFGTVLDDDTPRRSSDQHLMKLVFLNPNTDCTVPNLDIEVFTNHHQNFETHGGFQRPFSPWEVC